VPGIDGLLKLAHQQGANELRLAVGQSPKMFARGTPKRLSVPAIPEPTLRTLLEGIFTAELERALRAEGSVETEYTASGLGAYRVTFRAHPSGFEVVFVEAGGPAEVSDDALEPASAVEPPPARPVLAPPEPKPARSVEGAAAPAQPAQPPSAASEMPRLAAWVRRAVALRASDLHLAEGECPCIRVDGSLEQLDNEVLEDLSAVIPLEREQTARLKRGESLDLALEVPGAARLRAHLYTTDAGTVAALRILPRAAPAFANLNMPVNFDDLIDLPHGLVLLCGAAGSGKSTTLAALAQEALRRRSIVLVTLEDPIEYALVASATSLVRRRQIGRDARDFASGVRDVLRADPDVLVLGELRDAETIALALTAAETGHLVLASLHSRSAASAIERIVDGFTAEQQGQVRLQLAEALRAVVAQRLVRRRHGEGRVPAVELLRVNRAVASLIREGKTAQIATVLQSARREGMLSLERCLADRVLAGEIQQEDAFAAANDSEALSIFLTR
jgi:twitching motility protein PilT